MGTWKGTIKLSIAMCCDLMKS